MAQPELEKKWTAQPSRNYPGWTQLGSGITRVSYKSGTHEVNLEPGDDHKKHFHLFDPELNFVKHGDAFPLLAIINRYY